MCEIAASPLNGSRLSMMLVGGVIDVVTLAREWRWPRAGNAAEIAPSALRSAHQAGLLLKRAKAGAPDGAASRRCRARWHVAHVGP